jgi:quercetin dioxygenase-like cupin family protein
VELIDLSKTARFTQDKPHRQCLYESRNLEVVAYDFEAGQELPVHCLDAEVAILILEGEGEFLGAQEMPVQEGTLITLPACAPHGVKARTRLRLVAFVAPPAE